MSHRTLGLEQRRVVFSIRRALVTLTHKHTHNQAALLITLPVAGLLTVEACGITELSRVCEMYIYIHLYATFLSEYDKTVWLELM